MGRAIKHNLKPVKKIELSNKNIKARSILLVICFLILIGSIIYILSNILNKHSGWEKINVNSSEYSYVDDQFEFIYDLGRNISKTPNLEAKLVTTKYTEALVHSYRLLDKYREYEGIYNINYINKHPNIEITIDSFLYSALEKMHNKAYLYLGPVYEVYEALLSSNTEVEAYNFDPLKNPEVKSYIDKCISYINSNHIYIELMPENKVELNISKEYQNFAEENGIISYIDFSWLANSFIIDYTADTLINEGLTNGIISTYDGYTRVLDNSECSYTYQLIDKVGKAISVIGEFQYSGQKAFVNLRGFKAYDKEAYKYFYMSDGSIRSLFVDYNDGIPKCSTRYLLGYSASYNCSDISLMLADIFIDNNFNYSNLNNISILYYLDKSIIYNDKSVKLLNLFTSEKISYNGVLLDD